MPRTVKEWIGKTDNAMPTDKVRQRILERLEANSMPEPNSGCTIWLGAKKQRGYGHLCISGIFVGAHRAAYLANVGPIPDGWVVMHKCDNPHCINPMHLKVGTQAQNIKDCIDKGRARRGVFRGERNNFAVLTAEEVSAIRSEPRKYGYRKTLAERFKISASAISKIVAGDTWRGE